MDPDFAPPEQPVVLETEHWRLNQRVDSALPGYLILESRDAGSGRLEDLPAAARRELGDLLSRAEAALTGVLGAERVHVCRWGYAPGFRPHFT